MATDIEIKAGLELDRAVAGVIGLECTHRVLGCDVEYYVDPRDGTSGIPKRFQPSTDLNAAFAAAQAVGLFRSRLFEVGVDGEPSRVWFNDWDGSSRSMPTAEGPTPALAICAAILRCVSQRPHCDAPLDNPVGEPGQVDRVRLEDLADDPRIDADAMKKLKEKA